MPSIELRGQYCEAAVATPIAPIPASSARQRTGNGLTDDAASSASPIPPRTSRSTPPTLHCMAGLPWSDLAFDRRPARWFGSARGRRRMAEAADRAVRRDDEPRAHERGEHPLDEERHPGRLARVEDRVVEWRRHH